MKFKEPNTSIEVKKGKSINFDKNDFKAIKLNGKIKIVPNNVADNLIELKRATIEKGVDIEVVKRENVSVKPIKTT